MSPGNAYISRGVTRVKFQVLPEYTWAHPCPETVGLALPRFNAHSHRSILGSVVLSNSEEQQGSVGPAFKGCSCNLAPTEKRGLT